ncbi:ABC transporter ATP-binding protein [bacterium]|nr:ABC transporter ATP-binding protein [bacterium]
MSVIEVKNLSKKYQLNERSNVTLRDTFYNLKDILFKSVGENKGEGKKEIFYALNDVSFKVKKNETLGIIGANGAGKSTLLKIISRITPPTNGEVKIKGKISSLLEVGTGFHPELTARDNIYLNGAILGMNRIEINKKFGDIVEFSGIRRFLDTPVKRFSSGMYVRLAFSVAAHMEPDILIIDEVLSVGDAKFQKKCLGKMDEITRESSRTILFVSHNMDAIIDLCDRCILLDKGKIKMIGQTADVVDCYLDNKIEKIGNGIIAKDKHIRGEKNIEIIGVKIVDKKDREKNNFFINEPFCVALNIKVINQEILNRKISFFILIHDNRGRVIISSFQKDNEEKSYFHVGKAGKIEVKIDPSTLLPGKYFVSAGVLNEFNVFEDWLDSVAAFRIGKRFVNGNNFDNRLGLVSQKFSYKVKE